jgi:hypothetical protein
MGITVALENEDGTQIETAEDPRNLFHRVLPAPEDPGFQWAGTIDWYGNTTFNPLQAERLLNEWRRLIKATTDAETLALLRRVETFLVRCSTEVHTYVKFYGD